MSEPTGAGRRGADVRSYGKVAWCYDELAWLWSAGRIGASKRDQLRWLQPGERVLYAGVGRGVDAVLAARGGARVTAIDVSERMLARVSQRLARAGATAALRCESVAEHKPEAPYDAVVVNYLLSCFAAPIGRETLHRLITMLGPGGRVLLADFAPPSGSRLARWLGELHYRPVCWAGWALGLADLHPRADHATWLEAEGLEIRERQRYRLWPRGPVFYESVLAQRFPR